MWLSLSNSFLSIVALEGPAVDPAQLLVRARVAGDIERVFPTATVTHTPKHDYAYRAVVPRTVVATALAVTVETINYTNFKNSVSDQARHDAYLECWEAMHELQRRKAGRRVPRLTQHLRANGTPISPARDLLICPNGPAKHCCAHDHRARLPTPVTTPPTPGRQTAGKSDKSGKPPSTPSTTR